MTDSSLTRRQVLAGAGGTGLLAAAGPVAVLGSARPPARRAPASADGTPEQIHLTWGADPATSVTVSWASPGEAAGPRVLLRRGGGFGRTIPAIQRTYTDGINGETVWTYHAEISGLAPDTGYSYTVTADNDSSAQPFTATFTTAPFGRAPFRFTSFGDLATPNTQWVLSYGQSADAGGGHRQPADRARHGPVRQDRWRAGAVVGERSQHRLSARSSRAGPLDRGGYPRLVTGPGQRVEPRVARGRRKGHERGNGHGQAQAPDEAAACPAGGWDWAAGRHGSDSS